MELNYLVVILFTTNIMTLIIFFSEFILSSRKIRQLSNELINKSAQEQSLKDKIKSLEMDLACKGENSDFQYLLNDLLSGRALVEVRRIEPSSVFLKSIKDR